LNTVSRKEYSGWQRWNKLKNRLSYERLIGIYEGNNPGALPKCKKGIEGSLTGRMSINGKIPGGTLSAELDMFRWNFKDAVEWNFTPRFNAKLNAGWATGIRASVGAYVEVSANMPVFPRW